MQNRVNFGFWKFEKFALYYFSNFGFSKSLHYIIFRISSPPQFCMILPPKFSGIQEKLEKIFADSSLVRKIFENFKTDLSPQPSVGLS